MNHDLPPIPPSGPVPHRSRRDYPSMKRQTLKSSKTILEIVECPWCNAKIDVLVEIGFLNHAEQMGKRGTTTSVRRSSSSEHWCVDPTLKGPRA